MENFNKKSSCYKFSILNFELRNIQRIEAKLLYAQIFAISPKKCSTFNSP